MLDNLKMSKDVPYIKQKKLNLIQAPVAIGQSLEGVEEAPEILLENGLVDLITELGWSVQDQKKISAYDLHWNSPEGLIPAHQKGINILFPTPLGKACEDLSKLTKQSYDSGCFTLTLGGDHSIAIGSIGGALKSKPDLGIIWVDAHGDFNTPETSPSGNIHGMPLSFLSGLMKGYSLESFKWLDHFLKPEQLVLVGIRSIDPEERQVMKNWGAKVFTMSEVDQYGIGRVMDMAMEHLNSTGKRPVHVSYDIDSVDPHFAPSTGTRVRGGLNYREAHYIVEHLARTEQLVGMDLVEINPRLGYVDPAQHKTNNSTNITVEIGLELIASALGKRIY